MEQEFEVQRNQTFILMLQVYMSTWEHADDEVEELYYIIEEILEEEG